MTCIIQKITHPFAYDLRQARMDFAAITNKPMTERPFYYENIENGHQYLDIYGCVGWPTKVSEVDDGRPGYIAIVAAGRDEHPIETPVFVLLDEYESKNIPSILGKMLSMRETYGYGLHPTLLQTWWGDCERFIIPIAMVNEALLHKEILISPPVGFEESTKFDDYSRAMQSLISKDIEIKRFQFMKGKDILKNRLREFKRDDPAVMAVGGLVHTLLLSKFWLDQVQENMFVIEGENE
jgi:hypothetical protein